MDWIPTLLLQRMSPNSELSSPDGWRGRFAVGFLGSVHLKKKEYLKESSETKQKVDYWCCSPRRKMTRSGWINTGLKIVLSLLWKVSLYLLPCLLNCACSWENRWGLWKKIIMKTNIHGQRLCVSTLNILYYNTQPYCHEGTASSVYQLFRISFNLVQCCVGGIGIVW